MSSRIANQKFQVWMKADQYERFLKELQTFGGATITEQFQNFWNWYLYAKQEGKLLKPETQETVKRDPDAPNCAYHVLSDDKWFCDVKKIEREVCISRYRRHCSEGKKCLPEKLEPRPRPARFIKDDSGRGKVDWGDERNGGFFNFSER